MDYTYSMEIKVQPAIDPLIDIKEYTAGKAIPQYIEKNWGFERIYQNTDLYCMKLLHIEKGFSTSEHFHLEKHETMYVISGILKIEYIKEKQPHSIVISAGEAFIIPPGFVHRLCAIHESVDLIEASTKSEDNDSIRLS